MPADHSSLISSGGTQKSPIFFTIQFGNVDAGLSDMLIRLSTLYKVGKALSYTYVHTPFICYRSSPLSFRDRIFKKFIGDKVYHYMNRFLGFDQFEALIHNKSFSNYEILEIDLETILQSGVDNLFDLRDKVVQAAPISSSKPVVIAFLSTENFYKYKTRSKVESLLQNTNINDETFRDLVTQNYWKARRKTPVSVPFEEGKLKLLIHIRRGDRAWVQLNKRVICLHGKEIAIFDTAKSMAEMLEQPSIGVFQRPVAISEIATLLNMIQSRYGAETFSTIIISDGYEKAFAEIWDAVNTGRITLSSDENKQLSLVQQEFEQELSILSNDSSVALILGESKHHFFQSFHAIASADVVIKTSGGFASVIHRFFKPNYQPLIVFDAAQLSDAQRLEAFLEQVESLAEKRKPSE